MKSIWGYLLFKLADRLLTGNQAVKEKKKNTTKKKKKKKP